MKSYILMDGRPNGSLANVLENMGLNEVIGAGWPRADIEFTDRLELKCDDWASLSTLIQGSTGNSVDAFYLGDLANLSRINGGTLGHEGRIYTLTWPAKGSAASPYAQRMVTLARTGFGYQGGSLPRAGAAGFGNLCLGPVSTTVSEEDLDAIGFAGTAFNAVVLPPYNAPQPYSYFDEQLVSLRSHTRTSCPSEADYANSCAAHLLRLSDSQALRPFLEDGGSLSMTAEIEGPTVISIRPVAGSRVARYRTTFYANSVREAGAGFAQAVRKALRQDLLETLPNWESPEVLAGQGWRDYELRVHSPSMSEKGSYQLARTLLVELRPVVSVELEHRLESRILEPARQRAADAHPDHGLAEEALLRDLARIPWAPTAPSWRDEMNWAWRYELVEMLLGRLATASDEAKFPPPPWADPRSGWRIEKGHNNGALTVLYPGGAQGDVFRWRLRLPPGTEFLPDKRSMIGYDDTMQLESSLRLS